MKKYLVLLFATLMVPSLSFADGSDAAKINLVKNFIRLISMAMKMGNPILNMLRQSLKIS
ncbi:hypothetical protein KCG55_09440 [Neisseria subflava]|uniref:hypothetical protein n=1 Tax=Neisseria subflava TaxID=28449 RepID=UPI0020B6688E|nr:hypothetical protein [Neisseria subflava]UTG73702.1 hypothetical protein KCG55_09440 [Neisseria subflava]